MTRSAVFEADNIRDWRGQKVIDASNNKIGVLEAVYVDTATDVPAFATIQVGMVGRHRLVFAPLAGATVGPNYLRVRAEKKLVTHAPSISMDGELAATDEPAVFDHYGLQYLPGAGGERRLARR
jgi:hypothetical protein